MALSLRGLSRALVAGTRQWRHSAARHTVCSGTALPFAVAQLQRVSSRMLWRSAVVHSSTAAETSADDFEVLTDTRPIAERATALYDEPGLQAWVQSFSGEQPGEKICIANLNPKIFGQSIRTDILHRVVVYQRAQWWQGTTKTKGRAEVRGGGRKPWPQKGTGRARAGSIRSPLFRGGGVVHGPRPRDHSIKLPKKIRSLGIRVALSAKYLQGDLIIVDSLSAQSHKTKDMKELIDSLGWRNALLMTGETVDSNLDRACANLPGIYVVPCTSINVYDMLKFPLLVLSVDALEYLHRRFEDAKSPGLYTSDVLC